MRLSQFILSNLELIIAEWQSFASTVLPESKIEKLALRDEAEEILKTIAADMETAQTEAEQSEKSKGRGPRQQSDTAAESHAADRLRLGFNPVQVMSEFRALRATVIRLWLQNRREMDRSDLDQLIRFNEGIDQALTESTVRSFEEIEKSRDFATAVLAHDLRNPLNAITSSAQLLQRAEGLASAMVKELASTLFDSGMHMSKLIETLLDLPGHGLNSVSRSNANRWILPRY
jgi:K+-sensing histidine kinase KdpD